MYNFVGGAFAPHATATGDGAGDGGASDADARYIVAFTGTTDGAYYVWEVRFVGEHGVEVVAQLEAIRAHGLSNGAADTGTYRVTPVRYIDGEGATPPLAGLS